MRVVTYTKTYNIDGALIAQGGSIEGILNAITALNAFVAFSKTMDSRLKDLVLQKGFDQGNTIIVGLKELRDGLSEFIEVREGQSVQGLYDDPSALVNIKRNVVLILNKENISVIGHAGRVFAGNRTRDNRPFIKLEAEYGEYFWGDDLATFDENVSVTPDDLDSRWIKEADFTW